MELVLFWHELTIQDCKRALAGGKMLLFCNEICR